MNINIESYYDKVTKDIAFNAVQCYSCLENGICKEQDCPSCETYQLLNDCYNELSAADKIKTQNEMVRHSIFIKPKKWSKDKLLRHLSILLIIPLVPIVFGFNYLIYLFSTWLCWGVQ